MYEEVRSFRTLHTITTADIDRIFNHLKSTFPQDWLLPLELYELAFEKALDIQKDIFLYLTTIKRERDIEKLVTSGLEIIHKSKIN